MLASKQSPATKPAHEIPGSMAPISFVSVHWWLLNYDKGFSRKFHEFLALLHLARGKNVAT
jgi:hypothetical protein